ncbi:MAG: hypothetical protein WBO88_07190 [Candidatus Dechloromonas phosphoritropha]
MSSAHSATSNQVSAPHGTARSAITIIARRPYPRIPSPVNASSSVTNALTKVERRQYLNNALKNLK